MIRSDFPQEDESREESSVLPTTALLPAMNRAAASPLSQSHILSALASKARALVKPSSHFGAQATFRFSTKRAYHQVYELRKAFKNASSQERNESSWLKIKNRSIFPKYFIRSAFMAVTAGELYRFDIGNTQPKYRVLLNNDESYVLSKKIKASAYEDFFALLREKIDTKQRCFILEGMGRVIFSKWLYAEDDAHFGNYLVDANNYFVGIDNDRCFYPLSVKFHRLCRDIKAIAYKISNANYNIQATTYNYMPLYLLADKAPGDMGTMHGDDYASLPVVNHQLAFNWEFMTEWALFYTQWLAKTPLFLNEKYFSTLKALTTRFAKELLIGLHSHDKDKQDTKVFVAQRLQTLANIAAQSTSFKAYLQTYILIAMKTVIYEMNQFFLDNKHYVLDTAEEQQALWEYFYKNSIREFNVLLSLCELCPRTDIAMLLEQYAINIRNNGLAEIKQARDFYREQGMNHHAHLAEIKLETMAQKAVPIADAMCVDESCSSTSAASKNVSIKVCFFNDKPLHLESFIQSEKWSLMPSAQLVEEQIPNNSTPSFFQPTKKSHQVNNDAAKESVQSTTPISDEQQALEEKRESKCRSCCSIQ